MESGEPKKIFNQWLSDYQGLVFKIVRTYADPADWDDLFQDIMMQLWQSIPAFKQQSKASTWIYRVALNTALAKHRKEKKHKRHRSVLDMDSITLTDRSAILSDESTLIQQLYDAIRKLSKIDSSIVLMHLDDLSHREIAEVLGISENHVGVLLYRAKKELALLLGGVVNEF